MIVGKLFQHTDGGFYRYKGLSRCSVDQSTWVIYEHVWPYLPELLRPFWHRPLDEWQSRFTEVPEEALEEAMKKNRVLAQAEILHKRRLRKEEGK